MSSWNTPDYQGIKDRFLSPDGVKEMNCHYTMAVILGMLLKVSEPTDLDAMRTELARLTSLEFDNHNLLASIDHLPLMYGQDGNATKFRPLANGGFQIDWQGGLPGGDWDTKTFPNTASYGPYVINGADITSSQVLVFVNGNKLNTFHYTVTNDGVDTFVQISPSYPLPTESCIEILYRRNVAQDPDVKVKVSGNDTVNGFLYNKIQTSGFLKPVTILNPSASEILEIGTAFNIPTPTGADIGKVLSVTSAGNTVWSGSLGTVITLKDNQTTQNEQAVHNGENVIFASGVLDILLSEPSAGDNTVTYGFKDSAEMLYIKDSNDDEIALLHGTATKFYSSDTTLDIVVDDTNKAINFRILSLLASL